jgi:hypothetical protein
MKYIQKYKGGRSANTSSANRKSENLRTYKLFLICGPSANEAICGPCIFCDLRTQLFLLTRKYINFPLTKISLKCFHSNLRPTFGFWNSFETIYMVFRSLNYTNVSSILSTLFLRDLILCLGGAKLRLAWASLVRGIQKIRKSEKRGGRRGGWVK